MYVCARVIRRLPAEGIAEGGNALAFGSSSVRVRIEREGDIVGFDHGWRKGIFSPLLITDVLILRKWKERERSIRHFGNPSIHPFIYRLERKRELSSN